jgi:hypothetical protein
LGLRIGGRGVHCCACRYIMCAGYRGLFCWWLCWWMQGLGMVHSIGATLFKHCEHALHHTSCMPVDSTRLPGARKPIKPGLQLASEKFCLKFGLKARDGCWAQRAVPLLHIWAPRLVRVEQCSSCPTGRFRAGWCGCFGRDATRLRDEETCATAPGLAWLAGVACRCSFDLAAGLTFICTWFWRLCYRLMGPCNPTVGVNLCCMVGVACWEPKKWARGHCWQVQRVFGCEVCGINNQAGPAVLLGQCFWGQGRGLSGQFGGAQFDCYCITCMALSPSCSACLACNEETAMSWSRVA